MKIAGSGSVSVARSVIQVTDPMIRIQIRIKISRIRMLVRYRFFLEKKYHSVRQEFLVCTISGARQTTGM
jgi:hypothetical protein